jgi:sporulation protein YlmC with PRC-barrel domain
MANINTQSNHIGTLVRLSDTGLTVADPAEDVRGLKLVDRHGEEIGTIDDLLVDDSENHVRFLRVTHGGFLGIGEDHFLVPVDAITGIDSDHVHIDRERSKLSDAPGYSPDVAEAPDYYPGVYGWWGYSPYWAGGYTYPGYPVYPR